MIRSLTKSLRLPLALGACLLVAGACRRTAPGSALTGAWRLTQQDGGFTGAVTHFSPDSAIYLTLNSDLSYEMRRFGASIGSGRYRLGIAPAFPGGPPGPAISFDGQSYEPYQIGPYTLVIGTSAYDGIRNTYVRN